MEPMTLEYMQAFVANIGDKLLPKSSVFTYSDLESASGNFVTQVVNTMRAKFIDNMNNNAFDSSHIDELMRLHKMTFWQDAVVAGVATTCVEEAYYLQLRERFPQFFSDIVEFECQKALTGKADCLQIRALLAIQGHKALLEQDVMLLRIREPNDIGHSRKGREATVTQQETCALIYNPSEVADGKPAVVCLDGRKFEMIDSDHTRCRVLSRQSVIDAAMQNGVYSQHDVLLPVMAVQPFWQHQFCEFLSRINHVTQQIVGDDTATRIDIIACRFLKDEINAPEYWDTLYNFPEVTISNFFHSNEFREQCVNASHLRSNQRLIPALKLMTILQ